LTSTANCCAASSVRRSRTLDDALHLFDLTAADVLEAGADALHGLDLLSLDALQQLALAALHSLVQLVQRTTALGRVGLDLGMRSGQRFLERLVDVGAQAAERRTLILAFRGKALASAPAAARPPRAAIAGDA